MQAGGGGRRRNIDIRGKADRARGGRARHVHVPSTRGGRRPDGVRAAKPLQDGGRDALAAMDSRRCVSVRVQRLVNRKNATVGQVFRHPRRCWLKNGRMMGCTVPGVPPTEPRAAPAQAGAAQEAQEAEATARSVGRCRSPQAPGVSWHGNGDVSAAWSCVRRPLRGPAQGLWRPPRCLVFVARTRRTERNGYDGETHSRDGRLLAEKTAEDAVRRENRLSYGSSVSQSRAWAGPGMHLGRWWLSLGCAACCPPLARSLERPLRKVSVGAWLDYELPVLVSLRGGEFVGVCFHPWVVYIRALYFVRVVWLRSALVHPPGWHACHITPSLFLSCPQLHPAASSTPALASPPIPRAPLPVPASRNQNAPGAIDINSRPQPAIVAL